jgi:DNA-binding NtrC family response regulator
MIKRILLIEPDHEISWSVFSLLHLQDGRFVRPWYDVEVAESAASAASQATTTDFGCVIMDADLPGMRGYDAIPLVRAITGNAPIIMVSTTNSLELERKVRQQSVYSYHIAPFDQDELRLAVRGALQEAERTRTLYRPDGRQGRQALLGQPRWLREEWADLASMNRRNPRGDTLEDGDQSHLRAIAM